MYGYEIPSYAREYLREWQRDDRFLRLRWSLDEPGLFILERKTRYRAFPDCERNTDRAVQYKDGYRKVFTFAPADIRFVRRSLALSDVQRWGGAKLMASRLQEADERERALVDRANRAEMEAVSSEAYDYLAWREGRRVAT